MPQNRAQLIQAPLAALSDVDMSTAPTDTQGLVYDAALGKWKPGAVAVAVSSGGAIAASRTLLDPIAGQFNGAAVTFPLTASGVAYSTQRALDLEVVLGGVQLQPGASYTVSGSSLTFSVAPAAGTPCYIIGTRYNTADSRSAAIAMSLVFG